MKGNIVNWNDKYVVVKLLDMNGTQSLSTSINVLSSRLHDVRFLLKLV